MDRFCKKFAYFTGIAMSIYHVVVLIFFPLSPDKFRSTHLLFVTLMIFLTCPAGRKQGEKIGLNNILLIVLSFSTCAYAYLQIVNLYAKLGVWINAADIVFGVICIIVVLEAARRTTGLALPIISVVFMLYGLFGQYIPGVLGHTGYSIKRLIFAIYSYDGIFGTPLETCATYVVMFILFSSFLEKTGAGEYFLELAKAVAGHLRGGPAKMAVISSALFGTISGSAVANVAGTGSITIPLMKKIGYRSQFAGAVEAVASTGGQIMPPIMAAGAFLMADILGISYLDIAKAAVIPALLYFFTVWISIDFESAKVGLEGLKKEDIPSVKKLIKEGWTLLLPLVILIFLMVVVRYSAIRSAFFCMIACMAVCLLDKKRKFTWKDFCDTCYEGGKGASLVAGACACAGIVIGVMGLTGLGGKISSLVISFSDGWLILALLLSMLTAILFGMGLPTTVSYLLCVSVLSPVLIDMGVAPLAAHLFIFYFACLSAITPPVALAAYTGAGIAGGKPIATAFEATKLGAVAFFVPYMFVFNPAFLLEGDLPQIGWSLLVGICSCFAVAACCQGYFILRLNWALRCGFAVDAGLLFYQDVAMDLWGILLFALLTGGAYYARHKRRLREPRREDQPIG